MVNTYYIEWETHQNKWWANGENGWSGIRVLEAESIEDCQRSCENERGGENPCVGYTFRPDEVRKCALKGANDAITLQDAEGRTSGKIKEGKSCVFKSYHKVCT